MFELAAISVVLLLFSIAGIVWDIASGLLVTGVDGILLMAVCLMMVGVFTLELYFVGRQAGWVPAFGGKAKNAPQPSTSRAVSAKAATPAAAGTTSAAVATAAAPSVAAKPPTAPGVPSAAPPTVPPPATEQPKPEPSS